MTSDAEKDKLHSITRPPVMTDLAQRIRDEFPGTPDEEIPGLIRMLRLSLKTIATLPGVDT